MLWVINSTTNEVWLLGWVRVLSVFEEPSRTSWRLNFYTVDQEQEGDEKLILYQLSTWITLWSRSYIYLCVKRIETDPAI